jgi:TrmH family RNA methyltransferase
MTVLTDAEATRLCVVLVRARNPGNIGAVARAMHDFGFPALRVVNEYPVPFEAARSAVDASDVMASAAGYSSLAEATADCTLVVGTTAVGERELRHPLLELPAGARNLRAELAAGRRVALLFGSEKTGLSNHELSFCHWLLTIPMYQHQAIRHPSMNLGQAVAVCLWELVHDRAHDGSASPGAAASSAESIAAPPADSATMERLTALLTEVLQATEYTRRHSANCDPAHIRRLVRRIGADAVDAPVWMGILRQVLWKLGAERK